MFLYKNLEEIIFHRHDNVPADKLIILTGYIGAHPVTRLKSLPFPVTLVYGLYPEEGIRPQLHDTLVKIQDENKNIQILYSKIPVHSKCYIWLYKKGINSALIGSANFSDNGLKNDYRESLAEITTDSYTDLRDYYSYILKNAQNCSEVDIKTKETPKLFVAEDSYDPLTINISFLSNGEVKEKSGLNWGNATGNSTIGDVYIPIHVADIRSHPRLFPPKQGIASQKIKGAKKQRQNDIVEFIWDDGTVMEGLLEGNNTVDGIKYPKQMCSSPNKNIMGKYLRNRLGVAIDYNITKEDLIKYGRTDITVTLLGEGIYGLDFSVCK